MCVRWEIANDVLQKHSDEKSLCEAVFKSKLNCEVLPVKTCLVANDFDASNQEPSVLDQSVSALLSTDKWLSLYGLSASGLGKKEVIRSIGFLVKEEYIPILGKFVKSTYSEGLFAQVKSGYAGRMYNITANTGHLTEIANRLSCSVNRFKSRLDWLTSGSRNLFGVVQEHSVIILLDNKTLSIERYKRYNEAVKCLISDQICKVAQFNIIRCQFLADVLSSDLVTVTKESILQALSWIDGLAFLSKTEVTSTAECISFLNKQNWKYEAVYLITDGSSSLGSPECLKRAVSAMKCALHVVAFNCPNTESHRYLQSLCDMTGGRFHSYLPDLRIPVYTAKHCNAADHQASLVVHFLECDVCPKSWQQRTDCTRLFEELEEARDTLKLIQQVLKDVEQTPDNVMTAESIPTDQTNQPALTANACSIHGKPEECMSSVEWLKRHGLHAQKLDVFDVLSAVSFKHCDGVINLLKPPVDDIRGPDHPDKVDHRAASLSFPVALVHPKLINARYCDQFVHVRWKDGSLVHVQVTPQLYRSYERRVNGRLAAIRQRINWLNRGSRELFGTIMEDEIYLLIDTSTSMLPHIEFVKRKLLMLLSEQLRHKNRINLVAFNSAINSWNKHLVPVNSQNLESAATWIKSLTCGGSTNTFAALQFALADKMATGVYLLSDGRPDQDPRSILLSMQLQHPLPIHTASFNCSDPEANRFLKQLAQLTGGRFHYFTQTPRHPADDDQWESEDLRLLRAEYRFGMESLEKMALLRDKCKRLGWKPTSATSSSETRSSTPGRHVGLKPPRQSGSKSADWISSISPDSNESPVPSGPTEPLQDTSDEPTNTEPVDSKRNTNKLIRVSSSPVLHVRNPTLINSRRIKSKQYRGRTQIRSMKNDVYYSLLNAMCRERANNSEDFVLLETKEMLDRQDHRYNQAVKAELEQARKMRGAVKRTTTPDNMEPTSIPNWIARYGLRAQELRLLDLLAPVAVPLRPTYVPALKRCVTSEVLRQTMPLAVISKSKPSHTPKVRLVNPQAIDYPKYERQLRVALRRIETKLVEIIEEFLDKKQIKRLRADANLEGISRWRNRLCWYQHRAFILEAFRRSGWPFPSDELQCLTNELDKSDITENLRFVRKAQIFPILLIYIRLTTVNFLCYWFCRVATLRTMICLGFPFIVQITPVLSMFLTGTKGAQINVIASQTNNNAQTDSEPPSMGENQQLPPNSGYVVSNASSPTTPPSCMNKRLDQPCTCIHCRYMGTKHTRTLSPSSVRSPNLSMAELYGVKSHTLSPDISQRDLPSDSIELGSIQGRGTPTANDLWAWDARYVHHQRPESPWLPSGRLSELYVHDHLCYRCRRKRTESGKHYRSPDRYPLCRNLIKKRRHKHYIFLRASMPNIQSSWPFEPKDRIPFLNPDDDCLCSYQKCGYLDQHKIDALDARRSHSVDLSSAKLANSRSTRPIHSHGISRTSPVPISQISQILSDGEQPTLSTDLKVHRPTSPAYSDGRLKSKQKFPCSRELLLPVLNPPTGPSDDQIARVLRRQCHQRVIAFNDLDGIFYPGLVQKCMSSESSVIRFRHNAELSEVPNQLTLPISDMTHTQSLNDGDTVLVRVKNVTASCECWVPARVQGGFLGSPDPRYPLRHRYQLRLFSGAKHVFRRRDILKINPKFHKSLVTYIRLKRGEPEKPAAAGEGQSTTTAPRIRGKKRPQKPEKPAPVVRKLEKRIKRDPESTAPALPKVPDKGDDSTMRKVPLRRGLPDRKEKPPHPVEEAKPVVPPKLAEVPPRPSLRSARTVPKPAPAPVVKSEPIKKIESKPVVRDKVAALPSSAPLPPPVEKPKPKTKRAPMVPSQPKRTPLKPSPKRLKPSAESGSVADTSAMDLPTAVVDNLMIENLTVEKDKSLSLQIQPEVSTTEALPEPFAGYVPSAGNEQSPILDSEAQQEMSTVVALPSNRSEDAVAEGVGGEHMQDLDNIQTSRLPVGQSTVHRISQDSNLMKQLHDGQANVLSPIDGMTVEKLASASSMNATENEENREHLEKPDQIDRRKPEELYEVSQKRIDQDTKLQKQLRDEDVNEPESLGLSSARSLPGPISEQAQKTTEPVPEMNPTVERSQAAMGKESDQAHVEGKVKQIQDERIEQLDKQKPSSARSIEPDESVSIVPEEAPRDHLKQPPVPLSTDEGVSIVGHTADRGLSKQLLDAKSDQTGGPESRSAISFKLDSDAKALQESEPLREEYQASKTVDGTKITEQRKTDDDKQLRKQIRDEEQHETVAQSSVSLLKSAQSEEAKKNLEKVLNEPEVKLSKPTVGDAPLKSVADLNMAKPLLDPKSDITTQSKGEVEFVDSISAMDIQPEVVPGHLDTVINRDEIPVAAAPTKGFVSQDLSPVKQLRDGTVDESRMSAAPSVHSLNIVSDAATALVEQPNATGVGAGGAFPEVSLPSQGRVEKFSSEASSLPGEITGHQVSPAIAVTEDADNIASRSTLGDAGSRLAQMTLDLAEQNLGRVIQPELSGVLATSQEPDKSPVATVIEKPNLTLAAEIHPREAEAANDISVSVSEEKANKTSVMGKPTEKITDQNVSQPKVLSQEETKQMPYLGSTLSEDAVDSIAASVGNQPTSHLRRADEAQEILTSPGPEKYDETQIQVKLLEEEKIDMTTMPEPPSLPSAESTHSTAPLLDVEPALKSGTAEELLIKKPETVHYDTTQGWSKQIHDERLVPSTPPLVGSVKSLTSETSKFASVTEIQKLANIPTEGLTASEPPAELGYIGTDQSSVSKELQNERIDLIVPEKTLADTIGSVDSAVALAGGEPNIDMETTMNQKTIEKLLPAAVSSLLHQDETQIDQAQYAEQNDQLQSPFPFPQETIVTENMRHSSLIEVREEDKSPAPVSTEPFKIALSKISISSGLSFHVEGDAIQMEDKISTAPPDVCGLTTEELAVQPPYILTEYGSQDALVSGSTHFIINELHKSIPRESPHKIESPERIRDITGDDTGDVILGPVESPETVQGKTSDDARSTYRTPCGSHTRSVTGRNISFKTLVCVAHRRSKTVGTSPDRLESQPRSFSMMSLHTKFTVSDESRINANFLTQTIIRVSSSPGNLAQLCDHTVEVTETKERTRTVSGKNKSEMQVNISQSMKFKVTGYDSQVVRSGTPRPRSSHGRRVAGANVATFAPLSDSGQTVGLVSKLSYQLQSVAERSFIKSAVQLQQLSSGTDSSSKKTHPVADQIRSDPKLLGLSFVNNPNGEPISMNWPDSIDSNPVIVLNDASIKDVDKLLSQSAHSLVVTQEIAVTNEYELELDDTGPESSTTPRDTFVTNLLNEQKLMDGLNEAQLRHTTLSIGVRRAADGEWQPAQLAPGAVSVADANKRHETPNREIQTASLISLQVITDLDLTCRTKDILPSDGVPPGSNIPFTHTLSRLQFCDDDLNSAVLPELPPNTAGSPEPYSFGPSVCTLLAEHNQDAETNGKSTYAQQSAFEGSLTNQTTCPTECVTPTFGLIEPTDSLHIAPSINTTTNVVETKEPGTTLVTTQWMDAEECTPRPTSPSSNQVPGTSAAENTKPKALSLGLETFVNEQSIANMAAIDFRPRGCRINPGASAVQAAIDIDEYNKKSKQKQSTDNQTVSKSPRTANFMFELTHGQAKDPNVEINSRTKFPENRLDSHHLKSCKNETCLHRTQQTRSPELVEVLNMAVSVMLADEGELELVTRVNVCIDATETSATNNQHRIKYPKYSPLSESMEESTMPPKSATLNLSSVTRVDLTVNGNSDTCKKADMISDVGNPKPDPGTSRKVHTPEPMNSKSPAVMTISAQSPSSLDKINDEVAMQLSVKETAIDAEVFVQALLSTSDNLPNSECFSLQQEVQLESGGVPDKVNKTTERPVGCLKMLGDASLTNTNERDKIPEQMNKNNMERDEASVCCTSSKSESFSTGALESLNSSSICATLLPRDKLVDLLVRSFPSRILPDRSPSNIFQPSRALYRIDSSPPNTPRISSETQLNRGLEIPYNRLLESSELCTNSAVHAKSVHPSLVTLTAPWFKVGLVSDQMSFFSEHTTHIPIHQNQIDCKGYLVSPRSEIRVTCVQISSAFDTHVFCDFSPIEQATELCVTPVNTEAQVRRAIAHRPLKSQVLRQPLFETIVSSYQTPTEDKELKLSLTMAKIARAELRSSLKLPVATVLYLPSITELDKEQVSEFSTNAIVCYNQCMAFLNGPLLLTYTCSTHGTVSEFGKQYIVPRQQFDSWSVLLTDQKQPRVSNLKMDESTSQLETKLAESNGSSFNHDLPVYDGTSTIVWERISKICHIPDARNPKSVICQPVHVSIVNVTQNESLECYHHFRGFQGKIRSCLAILVPLPQPPPSPSPLTVCSSSLTLSSLLGSHCFKNTRLVSVDNEPFSDSNKLQYDDISLADSGMRPFASPCIGDCDPTVDSKKSSECLFSSQNIHNQIQENTLSSMLKEVLVQYTPSINSTYSLSKSSKTGSYGINLLDKSSKPSQASFSKSVRSTRSENDVHRVSEALGIAKHLHSSTGTQSHSGQDLTPTRSRLDDAAVLVSAKTAEANIEPSFYDNYDDDEYDDEQKSTNSTNCSLIQIDQTTFASQTMPSVPSKQRNSMEYYAPSFMHYFAQIQDDPRVVHVNRSLYESLNASNSISSLTSAISGDLLTENLVSRGGNHDGNVDLPDLGRQLSHTAVANCPADWHSSLVACGRQPEIQQLMVHSPSHYATQSCPVYSPDSMDSCESGMNRIVTDITRSTDSSLSNDPLLVGPSITFCSGGHSPTAEVTITLSDPIEVEQNANVRDNFLRDRILRTMKPVTKLCSLSDCVSPLIGRPKPSADGAVLKSNHQKRTSSKRCDSKSKMLDRSHLLSRQSNSEVSDYLIVHQSEISNRATNPKLLIPALLEPMHWVRIPLEFIHFPDITFLLSYQVRALMLKQTKKPTCQIPTSRLSISQTDLTISSPFLPTELAQQNLAVSNEIRDSYQWICLHKQNLTIFGRPWHVYHLFSKRIRKIWLWSINVCTNRYGLATHKSVNLFAPQSVTIEIGDSNPFGDVPTCYFDHCPILALMENWTNEHYLAKQINVILISPVIAFVISNLWLQNGLSETELQVRAYTTFVGEQYNPCFPPNLWLSGNLCGQNLRMTRYFRTTLENLVNLPKALLDSTIQTIQPLLKVHAFTEVARRPRSRHSLGSSKRNICLVKQTVGSMWIIDIINLISPSFHKRYLCELQLILSEVQMLGVYEPENYCPSYLIRGSSGFIQKSELYATPNRFVLSSATSCQVANWTEMYHFSSSSRIAGLELAVLTSSIQFKTASYIVTVNEISPVQTNTVCTEQKIRSFADEKFSDQSQTELLTDSLQVRSADADNENEQRTQRYFFITPRVQVSKTISNIPRAATGIPCGPSSLILLSTESNDFHDTLSSEVYSSHGRSSTSSRNLCDSKCCFRGNAIEDRRRRWCSPSSQSMFRAVVSPKDNGPKVDTDAPRSQVEFQKGNFYLPTAGDAIEQQAPQLGFTKSIIPDRFVPVDKVQRGRIRIGVKSISTKDRGAQTTGFIPPNFSKKITARPFSQVPQGQTGRTPPGRTGMSPRQSGPTSRACCLTGKSDRGTKTTVQDPLKCSKKVLPISTSIPSKDEKSMIFKSRIPVPAKTTQKANAENVKVGVPSTKQVLYSTLRSRPKIQSMQRSDKPTFKSEVKEFRLNKSNRPPGSSDGIKIDTLKPDTNKSHSRNEKFLLNSVSPNELSSAWGARCSPRHGLVSRSSSRNANGRKPDVVSDSKRSKKILVPRKV